MRKLYTKFSGEIRLEYSIQYEEVEVIDSLIYNNRAERNKVIRLWRKLYPKEINLFYLSIIPKIIEIKEREKKDNIRICMCGCRQSFEVINYSIRKYIEGHKRSDYKKHK